MPVKIYYKIAFLFILLSGISVFNYGNTPSRFINFPVSLSVKDTILDLGIVKPSDSIVSQKHKKSKLLSKEGIVIKQYAMNANKSSIKDTSSLNNQNNKTNIVNSNNKDLKNNITKSISNSPFQNKNFSEAPSVGLFSQVTDKKNISKIELLNTIKQINQLEREIIKKNKEQKKSSPVKWLILLIAAILIVVILAFFIKEIFTLFLIAFMLVALVLLIGFL